MNITQLRNGMALRFGRRNRLVVIHDMKLDGLGLPTEAEISYMWRGAEQRQWVSASELIDARIPDAHQERMVTSYEAVTKKHVAEKNGQMRKNEWIDTRKYPKW